MSGQFTPGPWSYERAQLDVSWQPNYVIYPIADEDHQIAEVNGQINKSADAHLIAAAPDLYNALFMVADEFGSYLKGRHRAVINAALAKARGEPK